MADSRTLLQRLKVIGAVACGFVLAGVCTSCSSNDQGPQSTAAGAPISQEQASSTGGMNPKMEKKFGGDAGAATAPAPAAAPVTAPASQVQ